MELSQLGGSYHRARFGRVFRAAQVVCRTQPALSQQIKALEQELGCRLLPRIGRRKLLPTQEWQRLQTFVAGPLGQLDRTAERAPGGGHEGGRHATGGDGEVGGGPAVWRGEPKRNRGARLRQPWPGQSEQQGRVQPIDSACSGPTLAVHRRLVEVSE